jgi:hypothetical protein
MRLIRRLIGTLIAIAALALLVATTVEASNPNATYTCVKVKQNGDSDVRVDVPEPAVNGLTNAGFTCVADAVDEPEGEEDPGNGEEEDPGNDEEADPGHDPESGGEPSLDSGQASVTAEVAAPQAARSLYCSTNGLAFRANGEGMGIALNLFAAQGALLVEMGLVTPAIFYEGIGASCDVLPGFTFSGSWVDNVGDLVPGVAVYPLYIPIAA